MTYHDGFGDFDLGEYEEEQKRLRIQEAILAKAHVLDLDAPVKRTIKENNMNDGLHDYPTRGMKFDGVDDEAKAKQKRRSTIYDDTIHLSVDTQTPYSFSNSKEPPKEKFPTQPRMAVIYNEQYSYDSGYGHNGASDMCTGTSQKIVYFLSDEALEDWVIKATRDRKTFRVVEITPVETEVKAVFSVKK